MVEDQVEIEEEKSVEQLSHEVQIVSGFEEQVSLEKQRIQEEFNLLIESYTRSVHRGKVEIITKAFTFANYAHNGARRRSGEPYIFHPLAVARIVCEEMGLGSTSICSALLHDVVEDTKFEVSDINNMFGEKIAQIVEGLTKISGGKFGEKAPSQAETIRKLLVTMSSDIRVILIKMADRLHNMRTLSVMPPTKQYKIAGETFYIYAPLAHRLGLFGIKTELEDLSFKYEHPKEYQSIHDRLKETEKSRQVLFKKFAEPVDEKLQSLGFNYDMQYRVKSVYSIWQKMQDRNITFDQVYDIFAVRIVFESQEDVDDKDNCWKIYSAIAAIYKIHPDRIRDWVNLPKANGYQALHMTVMGMDGQWIEIQIRSRRMDEIAEKGFAAHWKYKEKHVEEDTELDKWLQTITEILENPNPDSLDFIGKIKLNLYSSEISVFTPKGEIKTLPNGATALDFAYELHTDVGNTCIGAKVNHKLVPLSHELASGDQIEILTSRTQHPVAEWINFVTTAKARTKIEDTLRRTRKEMSKKGEIKLIEAIEKAGFEPIITNLDKVAYYFGFLKREDLFYAIEKGDVTLPDNIKKIIMGKTDSILTELWRQTQKMMPKQKNKTPVITQVKESDEIDRTKPFLLTDAGLNRKYILAPCCKPIPGDTAMGFIDNEKMVIVHKLSCQLAMQLKSTFGERILSIAWTPHTDASYEATIEVKGIDSLGVLNIITKTISEEFNVNIQRLAIEATDGVFEGRIKMLVHNVEDIHQICLTLSKIKNIKSVARINN
ncbi:MAG: RelA/SpoT family protein [Tannerella sp.]|jgi:GTP pyrophosphokinase|nr:RelA/SpoT family protein [Tannerella sp.]